MMTFPMMMLGVPLLRVHAWLKIKKREETINIIIRVVVDKCCWFSHSRDAPLVVNMPPTNHVLP